MSKDEEFMQKALFEAQQAEKEGEIPIGAVVVCQGRILARTHNLTETLHDVTAHAEMLAITAAANTLGGKYLNGCTLYVTVEPCPMCAGALGWSQISRIVYGTRDDKRGYHLLDSHRQAQDKPSSPTARILHPKTEVTEGVLENECKDIIHQFFERKRQN